MTSPDESPVSCQLQAEGSFSARGSFPAGVKQREVHSGFATDVLKLATGTAASQVIGILAAPLIAHLFAPSAFGTLAVFAAAAGIISVVSCFRYEMAICLPKEDRDASHLVILCLCLVLVTTLVTLLLSGIFGGKALELVHTPELAGVLWLLPVNVLVTGLWSILTCWNQRKLRFGRITVMQVVMRLALTASQIGLGLCGLVSGVALIATTIFGSFVTCSVLAWQTLRDDRHIFRRSLSWKAMTSPWRRYSQFPRFGLAATALNSASFQLPSILLSAFFSTAVVGFYSFGFRILRVPGTLIGANVNRAFFPRAADAKLRGALGSSVEKALQYLITVSFFPCFVLSLTGGDLFTLFFGTRWHESGVYSQILSVWLFFWFVSSPLNPVFLVLEEQKLELRFQTANMVTRFVALLTGGLLGNARLALVLFALCGVGVYGAYCLAVMNKSGASAVVVGRVALSRIVLFLPVVVLFVGLKLWSVRPVVIAAAALAVLVVYYWYVVQTDPEVRKVLKRFVHYPTSAAE